MKYIAWMLIGISMGLCHATPAATTSQTHVRFRFSYGQTRFGDVDVELFDQEKPLTVANFLRYVRVGAYEGNFAHRCVPNVILQGGSGTVGDAYSSRSFEAVVEVPEFAPITNERRRDTGAK